MSITIESDNAPKQEKKSGGGDKFQIGHDEIERVERVMKSRGMS